MTEREKDENEFAAWGRLGRMVKLRAEVDEIIADLLTEAPSAVADDDSSPAPPPLLTCS